MFLHLWIQNSTTPGSTCYGNHSITDIWMKHVCTLDNIHHKFWHQTKLQKPRCSIQAIRQTAPKTSKEPRISIQQRNSETEIWNIHLLYLVCVRVYWISAPDLAGLESALSKKSGPSQIFRWIWWMPIPAAVHSIN